ELFLENSGTSIRFLTALCCLGRGSFRLDGNERMRARPIGELTASLASLGARVRCELGNGCPPVVVDGSGIIGGKVQGGGETSSQFLSALLLAVPAAFEPVTIEVAGTLVSEPYAAMTVKVCEAFGVSIESPAAGIYRLRPQRYQARQYAIEPDASAASYFFAAAAITGGEGTIPGLSRGALQGDVAFVDVLEQMGCTVTSGTDRTTGTRGTRPGVG